MKSQSPSVLNCCNLTSLNNWLRTQFVLTTLFLIVLSRCQCFYVVNLLWTTDWNITAGKEVISANIESIPRYQNYTGEKGKSLSNEQQLRYKTELMWKEISRQILRRSPFKSIIPLILAGILMHCWLCRPFPRPPQCWRPLSSLDSTSEGATLSTQRCEAESYTDKKEN